MIKSDNTIRRVHAKTTCKATDLILTSIGVACVNCRVLVTEHRGQYEKNSLAVKGRIG